MQRKGRMLINVVCGVWCSVYGSQGRHLTRVAAAVCVKRGGTTLTKRERERERERGRVSERERERERETHESSSGESCLRREVKESDLCA